MKIFQRQPIEAPPISQSASGRASNFDWISRIHTLNSPINCPEAPPLQVAYLRCVSQILLNHCKINIKYEMYRPRTLGKASPRSRMIEKTNKTGPNNTKIRSIEDHCGSSSKKTPQNLSIGAIGDQVCSYINQHLLTNGHHRMTNKYLAYYRVSTSRQGHSGLGLEAQKQTALHYLFSSGGQLLGEFTEIESGKKSERPMLAAALKACKQEDAVLLIAKLDRLARNVHFISGLLEADIRFVAADMPNADRFILHVYRSRSATCFVRQRGRW